MKKITANLLLPALLLVAACSKSDNPEIVEETPDIVQFVFTSDAHYGLTRPSFRGATNVDSHTVNAALVSQINNMTGYTFHENGGVYSGQKIDHIEYVLEAGDIANRMEESAGVQLASESWAQFETDYIKNLTVKDFQGKKATLYMVPGNHDVSNTIGYYAKMSPASDATSMAKIYNLMLQPTTQLTASTFNYDNNRINYSKEIGGLHFSFIQMWPDSAVRIWLEKDLAKVPASTPVVIMGHDQPAVVSNHFTNPNGDHDINLTDKFDNVLDEMFKDGKVATIKADKEQRAFAGFLKKHPNVKLYLHGHVHKSDFYTWKGPDNDMNLPVVGADSPMKGLESVPDEKLLSFAVIALDTKTKKITIRECFWNSNPTNPNEITWGKTETLQL